MLFSNWLDGLLNQFRTNASRMQIMTRRVIANRRRFSTEELEARTLLTTFGPEFFEVSILQAPTPNNSLIIEPIGSYASGTNAVAEIVAHDPITQRLFSLNGANNRLDVLDLSNPTNPTKINEISLAGFGALPNSVAVKNGVVAVAMEAAPKTDAGIVVFFSTAGVFQSQVTVGSQPDMLTFTPDGLKVLVANEGEPNVGDTVNPDGSVSIISLTNGVLNPTVQTATFTAFNGQEDKLRGQGVRITAGKSFAVDAEPEYIAVSPDGTTARVTLQESNAFAVLDLTTNTITSIQALGLKDFNTGTPVVTTYDFVNSELPLIGTTSTGQDLRLGGFSGLHFEGINPGNGNLKFIVNTDRGPNGEPSDSIPGIPGLERPFALPDFTPELVRIELNQSTGQITITSRIQLKEADGTTLLSGLPNLQAGAQGTAYTDEVGVDLFGVQLPNDPLGADMEGIVVAADGSFWLPDEYRPAIYHFDSTGKLLDRFVPQGTAAAAGQPAGTFGTEALPAVYGQFRRANRGFEAIAMEGTKIYTFIQTNLDNPTGAAAVRNNGVIRIVEFETTTNTVTGEYVYVMRDTTGAGTAKTDKIGDAVSLGGGKFLVVERDDRTTTDSNKLIYEINLTGATNVTGTPLATAITGTTLESLSPAGLATNGIRPVNKRLVVNAAAIGYTGVGKLEGLAVIDSDTIALLNDNDFQMAGAIAGNGSAPVNPNPEPIRLGLIDFFGSNGLDSSDRDVDGTQASGGEISINHQPVFGMYMPDGVAAYAVGGKNYFVTANEGDSREDFTPGEERRIGAGNYVLDPTTFPNSAALKNNAVLGRLTSSALDGDLDNDGDFDRIQIYGARSFTIWDAAGNRIFDSGDALEQITAAQFPAFFNSDGADASFDTRSDNKGPEPEGVAIGNIDGRIYAFVGLERIGGFITFDVTDPLHPQFVTYTNPAVNAPGTPGQTDLSPEGIIFIPAAASPTGQPLVVTGNEVSGTATIYSINVNTAPTAGTLEDVLVRQGAAPSVVDLFEAFEDADTADEDLVYTVSSNSNPQLFSSVQIVGRQLSLNYDPAKSGTSVITVTAEDAGGLSVETSFTVTVNYTLQLLHASDMEAGLAAVQDAPNFAAVVDFFDNIFSNTLILSSGDNYIPGTFFNAGGDPALNALLGGNGAASVGRADIEILNRIGIEASAFGNHEFDAGTREVRNIIAAAASWGGAQFPYLSSNLNFTTDANFNGLTRAGGLEANTIKGRVAPSAIITEGGEKIGVVGVTTPMLASISSPGSVGVSPANADDMAALAAIVQPAIDALIASGTNKIIVMSHLQQISLEQVFAPLLHGVDIVIAGGSNTLLADGTDRLRAGDIADGNYPLTFTNADGDAGLIVNTDGNYKYVGRLVIEFDAQGKLLPGSYLTAESGVYATDNQGVQDLWGNLNDPFLPGTKGAAVKQVTDAVANVINTKDGIIYGHTDVYLNGLRAEIRTEETNLGNLSADANLAQAQAADPTVTVSIKNGGGLRDSIGSTEDVLDEAGNVIDVNRVATVANPAAGKNAGDISQLDIENSLRFNNSLSMITVSAANLKRILEHAVAATAPGATPGQFPQIGGIAFSFDTTQTAQVLTGGAGVATVTTEGHRIRNLARIDENGLVVEKIVENGVVVGDPNRQFRIVTLGFLIDDGDNNGLGGDNYPFPTFGTNRVNLGVGEQAALSDYLQDEYPVNGPAYNIADTPAALDTRIQNLGARNDTIFTNTAPSAVALENTVTTLTEGTDTATAIKVADIVVSDDALGTNTLSVSGADAASFEIVGSELRLKAGTVLDFETKTTYAVTVNVDDATVGGVVDASVNYTLTMTNVSDAPVVTVGSGSTTSVKGREVIIAPAATLQDQDTTDFNTGKIKVSIVAGVKTRDRLRVATNGKGADKLQVKKSGELVLGKRVIGTVTGGDAETPLEITFNTSTSTELAQRVLKNISFQSHKQDRGTRTVQIEVIDETGHGSEPVTKDVIVS